MATDTQSQPMEVQGVITPALQLLANQNNGKGGLEKLERWVAVMVRLHFNYDMRV